jgi:hypothetical protein
MPSLTSLSLQDSVCIKRSVNSGVRPCTASVCRVYGLVMELVYAQSASFYKVVVRLGHFEASLLVLVVIPFTDIRDSTIE